MEGYDEASKEAAAALSNAVGANLAAEAGSAGDGNTVTVRFKSGKEAGRFMDAVRVFIEIPF